jgi:RNA polymerase sigma-B factor
VPEIAHHVGCSCEQVLEAREVAGAHRALSLNQPAGDDDESTLGGSVGADDPGYDRAEDAATVALLLRDLDDRDHEILRLRFIEDLTQSQIGARLGLSQMHVSRLIRQALAQLHTTAQQRPSGHELRSPAFPQ